MRGAEVWSLELRQRGRISAPTALGFTGHLVTDFFSILVKISPKNLYILYYIDLLILRYSKSLNASSFFYFFIIFFFQFLTVYTCAWCYGEIQWVYVWSVYRKLYVYDFIMNRNLGIVIMYKLCERCIYCHCFYTSIFQWVCTYINTYQ